MSNVDTRRLVAKCGATATCCATTGVATIEYTEQLTYLLFLKMAHERATRRAQPDGSHRWQTPGSALLDADGDELEDAYRQSCGHSATSPARSARSSEGAEQDPGSGQAQAARSST